MDYATFIDKKSDTGTGHGFEPVFMPDFLFDFQRHLVEWAIRRGRGVGIELKPSYYKQAVRNLARADADMSDVVEQDATMFDGESSND